MPILPNTRHEKYCINRHGGMTQDDAYAEAGFVRCRHNAWRLNAKPHVQKRLRELAEESAREAAVDAAYVIKNLVRNVSVCMGDKQVSQRIKRQNSDEVITIEVTQRDPAQANRALELLGKSIGMFIDRKEISGSLEVDTTDKLAVARAVMDILMTADVSEVEAIEGVVSEVEFDNTDDVKETANDATSQILN